MALINLVERTIATTFIYESMVMAIATDMEDLG
jgi:hypothetical protein